MTAHPEDRHQLGEWLNSEGLIGEGAEIGVLHGSFSRIIMEEWRGRKLHLVDPWCKQDDDVYREITNRNQDWTAALKESIDKMVPYSDRVVFHRMLSVPASENFHSGQLDFVFIDGNHSYESVSEDLKAWWPKVKSGGLFSGHDYENILIDGKHCEVKRAVDEFVSVKNLTLHHTDCSSWWIRKP